MAQSDMKTIMDLTLTNIDPTTTPPGRPLDEKTMFVVVVNEPGEGEEEHLKTQRLSFPALKSSITGSPWTDVTGVLTAGSTSVTISDASILATSTIQVFTDPALLYNSITVAVGSVTLTFDEQQSDVSVKVRVS